MNVPVAILFLAVGLVLLWKCADFLVAGAVGLAEQLGVSRLVVGLTVVAMGTSAPEVAASIAAVVRGIGDVAIGNVYGSNIANLALVGGDSGVDTSYAGAGRHYPARDTCDDICGSAALACACE